MVLGRDVLYVRILHFQSGIPYISHSCTDGGAPIALKTAQGMEIPIKEKNKYTPRKNLGHFKAPAGTYTK